MFEIEKTENEDKELQSGLKSILDNKHLLDESNKKVLRRMILIRERHRLITTGNLNLLDNIYSPPTNIEEKVPKMRKNKKVRNIKKMAKLMGFDLLDAIGLKYTEYDGEKEITENKEIEKLEILRNGEEKDPHLQGRYNFTVCSEITNSVKEITRRRVKRDIVRLSNFLQGEGIFNIPEYKRDVSDFEEGLLYGYPPFCIKNFSYNGSDYNYNEKDLSEFEKFLIEDIREGWKIYTDEGLKQSIFRSYENYQTLSKYKNYHDIIGVENWMETEKFNFINKT